MPGNGRAYTSKNVLCLAVVKQDGRVKNDFPLETLTLVNFLYYYYGWHSTSSFLLFFFSCVFQH
ncbi:hypothetical protein V6Z11_A12G105500 [Gossypium hirsutum]